MDDGWIMKDGWWRRMNDVGIMMTRIWIRMVGRLISMDNA